MPTDQQVHRRSVSMQPDATGQSTKTAIVGLAVPVMLPLAIIELLERQKLTPYELFDVALALRSEAVDSYALDQREVFSLDRAWVELERSEAGSGPSSTATEDLVATRKRRATP